MPTDDKTVSPTTARNGKARGAPIFLLALVLGVAAHAAGLALFRVTVPHVQAAALPPPYVTYSRASASAQADVQQREARFFDPARLYLSAALDVGARETSEHIRPLAVFEAEPANVTVSADDFRKNGDSANLTIVAADVLKPRRLDVFSSLGQATSEVKPLERRGARLQVTRIAASALSDAGAPPAVVESFSWPVAKAPPAGAGEWKPARFSVIFDGRGLFGQPTLVSSSRNDAVDKHLREQIGLWFSGHPQPPGTYEVVVGP